MVPCGMDSYLHTRFYRLSPNYLKLVWNGRFILKHSSIDSSTSSLWYHDHCCSCSRMLFAFVFLPNATGNIARVD